MMRLAQQPFRPMGLAPQPLIMPGFSRPQVLQAPPLAPYLPGRDVPPGPNWLQNFVGGGGLLAAPPVHSAPRPSAHTSRIPPVNVIAGSSSLLSYLLPQPLRASAGSSSDSPSSAPSNTTLDSTADEGSHASLLPHGGVPRRPAPSLVAAVAGPSRKPPQVASARVSATPPADVSWMLATDSGDDDEASAEVIITHEQQAPSRARSPTRSPLAVLDPTQASPSHSLPSSSKSMLAASKPTRSHPKPSRGVGLAVQRCTSPSILCRSSTPHSNSPQASMVSSLPGSVRHAHRAPPRQLPPPSNTAAGSDIDMNSPLASRAAQAASSKSPGPAAPSSPALGMKRRLGMGHRHAGYSNKKFKPPV
jgi:hypothetical protein